MSIQRILEQLKNERAMTVVFLDTHEYDFIKQKLRQSSTMVGVGRLRHFVFRDVVYLDAGESL